MSIKLYSGIKFTSNKLGTVIKQLNSLKEDARKNVMKTFTKDGKSLNFVHLLFLYEEAMKDGKEEQLNSNWGFEWLLHKELRKPYNDFDFEFGVTIFERKNKLYGVYYDQTGLNYKMLFDRGIAVDYHYQNQTDPPEDVSARDWDFREEVWEDIFGDISPCWVPSEAGAVYKIIDMNDIHITDDIMKDIKDAVQNKNTK